MKQKLKYRILLILINYLKKPEEIEEDKAGYILNALEILKKS